MKKQHRKSKYLISPYVSSLVFLVLALMAIGNGILFAIWLDNTKGMPFEEAVTTGDAFGCLFVFSLTLLMFLVFLFNSFEYFGTVEICSDKLVFRAIFHRKRVFEYAQLKDVGIDYGVISGHRQFWIYVAKTGIPKEYCHKITRMPYRKTMMRIQYRKDVYKSLLQSIPYDDLGKRLSRSSSVLRLFGVQE